MYTEEIQSTNPVAHPIPNPRINAKHEARSAGVRRPAGEIKKNSCNTSQAERQSEAANSQPPMSFEGGVEGMEYRITEKRSRIKLAKLAI